MSFAKKSRILAARCPGQRLKNRTTSWPERAGFESLWSLRRHLKLRQILQIRHPFAG